MQPYSVTDAEADLRDAINSGDPERINAASARVEPAGQAVAARDTARQRFSGTSRSASKVFPLSPGSKIPFKGSKGCLNATTDTDQVNRWWTAEPDANIGIATGHLVNAVNIDGLEKARHHGPSTGMPSSPRSNADNVGKVLTPRKGGLHVYVPATGDANSTNLVHSVNYRGAGGYVVAPPSVTPDGNYRWLGEPRFKEVS